MLAKQLLHAVIEFATTVRAHQPVIMGYLVCHKNTKGYILIQLIDQTMQKPDDRK